jgi:hypothetical protein
MVRPLRQSTAASLQVGPFVDNGDAYTFETGLTIAQADVMLSKNGNDAAQKHDATISPYKSNGNYLITFDTTDTATIGELRVDIYKAGALPVWDFFWVYSPNDFDSMFAGSDNLEVDSVLWGGADLPSTAIFPVGSVLWSYPVTRSDTHAPIPGVQVEAYKEAGCTTLAGVAISGADGLAWFRLIPGTYYFLCIGGPTYAVPAVNSEVVS